MYGRGFVQLHLKSKQIAWCGIIMAMTVILQVLAGVIGTSTFFMLAAASFLTGCIESKFDLRTAACFCAGAVVLGFILSPQKLYCFTYAGFCIYVLAAEYFRQKNISYEGPFESDVLKKNIMKQYIIKGILYHVLLIAASFISVEIGGLGLLFSTEFIKNMRTMPVYVLVIAVIVAAELLWIIFDKAYIFFQDRYGSIICGREN